MNSIHEALVQALGPIPPHDIDPLIQAVTIHDFQAETIICHEGDVEYAFYIIQRGNVAFTKKMEHGEQLLGYKGAGEFFGELGILDHAPRAANVLATTDCTLIRISEELFDQIISHNPLAARSIMRGITRSMRDTDRITIAKLQLTNQELARTLDELRAAQAELLRRERLKRDMEIAANVHQSILPDAFPNVANFEFAALARPAREVGGDLYDIIPIDDNRVGIVMADASGKSVQAAIYMAIVKTLFLSQANPQLSPAEVAHRVHDLLLKASTAEMFVTVFFAALNFKSRQITYVRGGHDRPILYRAATGATTLLDAPGRFLGLLPNLIIQEDHLSLQPGDTLVCYSDGVTDAVNNIDNSMYGLERLRATVAQYGHQPAQTLVQAIVADVDRFRDNAEQPDDLTLLVTKALP